MSEIEARKLTRQAGRSRVSVPPLPEGMILDVDDQERPEGKLKAVRASPIPKFTGLMSSVIAAVASDGEYGVGITTAFLAVANDKEVQDVFEGGVFWVSLSEDSSDTQALEAVIEIMSSEEERRAYNNTPTAHALSVNSGDRIRGALEIAKHMFDESRCLFIIDDCVTRQESGRSTINHLEVFLELAGKNCTVLFSTKNKDDVKALVRPKLDKLVFGRVMKDVANQVFQKALGRQVLESEKQYRETVMDLTGLFALNLRIIGSATRKTGHRWKHVISVLTRCSNELRYPREVDSSYSSGPRLTTVIACCLELVKNENISSLHYSLSALPLKTWAPIEVFSALWNVGYNSARDHCQLFKRFSLIKGMSHRPGHEGQLGADLHTGHILRSQKFKKLRSTDADKAAHSSIVDSYSKVLKNDLHKFSITDEWRKPDNFEEDYYLDHLAQHYLGSARFEELEGLLLDYRWIERRITVGGVLAIRSDYEWTLNSEFAKAAELDATALTWINSALISISGPVFEDKSQLPYQICGRLVTLSRENRSVGRLLSTVYRFAERPWLTPLWQSFPSPGGLVEEMPLNFGKICAMRVSFDRSRIVSGSEDSVVTLWDTHGEVPLHCFEMHSGKVKTVCISADNQCIQRIVSSDDTELKILNTSSRSCEKELSHLKIMMTKPVRELNFLQTNTDGSIISFRQGWYGHQNYIRVLTEKAGYKPELLSENRFWIVTLSEDGKLAAAANCESEGNFISVFDTFTRIRLAKFGGRMEILRSLRFFSPLA